MDGQIFPSLIYAMADLQTERVQSGRGVVQRVPEDMRALQVFANQPLAIEFSSPTATTATIRIRPNELMEASSVVVKVPPQRPFQYPLSVTFRYRNLAQYEQSRPLNVQIEVSFDGRPFQSKTSRLTIRSINDCPLWTAIPNLPDRGYALSWMFAAYVNEEHPGIPSILHAALSTRIVSQFDGYQSRNIDQVRNQIRAVWIALCMRNLRYSNITTTANRSTRTPSQYVRLFDQALASSQANCVDGSALIASILTKIGLDVDLVQVPGHMFVRVWLDPWFGDDRKSFVALETTVMGQGFPLPADSTLQQAIEAANVSYVLAWNAGNDQFDKSARLFDITDSAYRTISIGEARRRGIIPIPSASPAPRGRSSSTPPAPPARGRSATPQPR